jgi:hypothetical protein
MQNLRLILNLLKKLQKISYQKVFVLLTTFCVNFMELFNEFEISLKFCTC